MSNLEQRCYNHLCLMSDDPQSKERYVKEINEHKAIYLCSQCYHSMQPRHPEPIDNEEEE